MKSTTLVILTAMLATLPLAGCERSGDAETAGGSSMQGMPGMQQSAQTEARHSAEGTVNSVDRAAGTINISHGPVASASWPAMTMSFKLAEPTAAEGVEPGQRINFDFTIQGGMAATVTRIDPAN